MVITYLEAKAPMDLLRLIASFLLVLLITPLNGQVAPFTVETINLGTAPPSGMPYVAHGPAVSDASGGYHVLKDTRSDIFRLFFFDGSSTSERYAWAATEFSPDFPEGPLLLGAAMGAVFVQTAPGAVRVIGPDGQAFPLANLDAFLEQWTMLGDALLLYLNNGSVAVLTTDGGLRTFTLGGNQVCVCRSERTLVGDDWVFLPNGNETLVYQAGQDELISLGDETSEIVAGGQFAYLMGSDTLLRFNFTDLTTSPVPLRSVSSLPNLSSYSSPTLVDSGLLFVARAEVSGAERLVLYDLDSVRAVLPNDTFPVGESWPRRPISRSGNSGLLYRRGATRELWVSDGTAAGTRLVNRLGQELEAPLGVEFTYDPSWEITEAFSLPDGKMYYSILEYEEVTTAYRLDTARLPVPHAPFLFYIGRSMFEEPGAYALSDRLLFSAPGSGPDRGLYEEIGHELVLLSAPPIPADNAAVLLRKDTALVYLADTEGPEALVYRTNSATPIDTFSRNENGVANLRAFSFGGRNYLCGYQNGTFGYFRLSEDMTNSTRVGTLFPDDSEGIISSCEDIYAVDSYVSFSLADSLLVIDPATETAHSYGNRRNYDRYLTTVDSVAYVANGSFKEIFGIDLRTGEQATVYQSAEGVPAINNFNPPAVLNGSAYLIRGRENAVANTSTYTLVRVDLAAAGQEVLRVYEVPRVIDRAPFRVLTDGRFLYVTSVTADGVLLLNTIDPLTGADVDQTIEIDDRGTMRYSVRTYRVGDYALAMSYTSPRGSTGVLMRDGQLVTRFSLPDFYVSTPPLPLGREVLIVTQAGIFGVGIDSGEVRLVTSLTAPGSYTYRTPPPLRPLPDGRAAMLLENDRERIVQLVDPQLDTVTLLRFEEEVFFTTTFNVVGNNVVLHRTDFVDDSDILLLSPTDGSSVSVSDVSELSEICLPTVIGSRLYFMGKDARTGMEVRYIDFATPSTAVRGMIFDDENGNGQREENEAGIANVQIAITAETTAFTYTNEAGFYQYALSPGTTYRVEPRRLRCRNLTTEAPVLVTAQAEQTEEVDFGLALEQGLGGVRVDITSATLRCGRDAPVWGSVRNDGCSVIDTGTVTFVLPEGSGFISSETIPAGQTDTSVTFALSRLLPGASYGFKMVLRLPNEDFVGTPVLFRAMVRVTEAGGGVLVGDGTFSDRLRCAIDPNDKLVHPRRAEPSNSNYTQTDETITYTVRFQNTGNDTAFTVRIEDQLSPDLDWGSLKNVTASHPFTASVSDGGLAVFLFNDILLVDSLTNEPESHGFVRFEIMARSSLVDFTRVDNSAGIFFDFNRPIITNTVSSTLVELLDVDGDGYNFYEDCDDLDALISPAGTEIPGNGIDEDCDEMDGTVGVRNPLPGRLTLAPNPFGAALRLSYSERQTLLVILTDAVGRQLDEFSFRGDLVLPTTDLPAGMYYLRFSERGTGRSEVRRVVRY